MSKTVGHWIPGSFVDNLNAAVDHLGHENVGAAWGLASIKWESESDRTGFLNAMTQVPWNEIQKGTQE